MAATGGPTAPWPAPTWVREAAPPTPAPTPAPTPPPIRSLTPSPVPVPMPPSWPPSSSAAGAAPHPSGAGSDGPTVPTRRRSRVVGVDVARGVALLGMLAVHTFPVLDDGEPTLAGTVAAGRSAATFALVAGIGLAFLSGGRRVATGRDRAGARAGLLVRGVLIGLLGLTLGLLSEANGVDGILPEYGLLFLLAVPLIGLAPRVLAALAAAAALLGPLLIVGTADLGLPNLDGDDPTLGALATDPVGLLSVLAVTGEYPAVVYLAYLCAGLAVGRLDLSSPRVAGRLLAGGAALAVAASVVSTFVLYPLGGLARLAADAGLDADDPEDLVGLLWEPDPTSSPWYLALPAPHSHTLVDVAHTLGSALAVVGAALLLTRIAAVARLLAPLAAAGSMALTLYSAHLVVLATGLGEDEPALLYPAMVVAALVFATWWRGRFGAGPLERLVTAASGAARRAHW